MFLKDLGINSANKPPPKSGTVRRKLKPEDRKAALKMLDTLEEKRLKYVTLYPLESTTIHDGLTFEANEMVEVGYFANIQQQIILLSAVLFYEEI